MGGDWGATCSTTPQRKEWVQKTPCQVPTCCAEEATGGTGSGEGEGAGAGEGEGDWGACLHTYFTLNGVWGMHASTLN